MKHIIIFIAALLYTAILFSQPFMPKYTFERETDALTISYMKFSPDGNSLAYGTLNGQVIIKDMISGQTTLALGTHNKMVVCVAFTPDGKYLASGSKDGVIKIWDLDQKKEIKSFIAHKKAVMALAYSADRSYFFSGSRDNTINIWNPSNYTLIKTISDISGNVKWILFSPDGKNIIAATSALMKGIRIFDIESGNEIKTFESANTEKICITPDESELISANIDKKLFIWDAMSGELLGELVGHTKWANSVDISPGGKIIVSAGDDNTVRLWDLERKMQLYHLGNADKDIDAIAYSPNGKYIAASSWDQKLRVWDISGLDLPKENIYEAPEEIITNEITEEEQEVLEKTFKNLHFETGKAIIKEESFSYLDQLAELLKNKTNLELIVSGHTDNVGDANANYKLSIMRAEAVKTYLQDKGVNSDNIVAQGFGATKPLASNMTEEGRAVNRRVELVLIKK